MSLKMKVKVLLFLALFMLSCRNNPNSENSPDDSGDIRIEGILENGIDRLVTLDLMGPNEFVSIDSVRCDQKGRFNFNFKGDGVNFYALKYTEHGYVTIIARPGDRIRISGNPSSLYPYSVEGSDASELVRQLAESHNEVLEALRNISSSSEAILGDEDYVDKKQKLNERFDSITAAFHAYSKDFILRHPESPAILIALYNQYGPGLPVFHPLTDLEIYQFADSSLYSNFPANEAVKSLHSQLSAALQQLRNQNPAEQIKPGDRAPDFVLESSDGKQTALSDLRGKYVLIQFWASWSKPSMDENRFLMECYKRFGNSNFAILEVSIDSDRKEWEQAIGESLPGWYHLSDLRRWDSPVVDLYRVERIPSNFLVDPAGKIVEKDKFGEDLITCIEKYIN